jgi:carboxyl-terminal processing protease
MKMRLLVLAITLLLFRPVYAQDVAGNPKAAFAAFWSLYNDNYALFGVKRVQWDAVRAVYQQRISASTSRAELFQMFSEVIKLLNDVHVSVRDERRSAFFRSGARSIGVGEFENGEFSLDLVASRYAASALNSRVGGLVHFGELRGEVGYLRLRNFKYPTSTEQALDEALAAFSMFINPRVLIVDVRHNGGGADAVGLLVANRFADRRRHYMSVINRRSGAHPADFSPTVEWYVEPQAGRRFEGKIIVLTNSRTISAAENFVLAMRTIPGVMIIGDVTAGAMADTLKLSIADGWTFTVPVNIVRDAQGVCWEGVGLTPDLWVANTAAEVAAGTDRVLDLALTLARTDR